MTSLRRLALAFFAINSLPAASPQQRQQDASLIQSSSPQENAALHSILTPLSPLPDSERAVATRAPAAFGRKAAVEAPSSRAEPAAGAKRELGERARSPRDWEV